MGGMMNYVREKRRPSMVEFSNADAVRESNSTSIRGVLSCSTPGVLA